jgi:UDP-N-acetylmuramate--L-alanine ligase/UDP-N-acetylenolpyruvoylglucosamine reductase
MTPLTPAQVGGLLHAHPGGLVHLVGAGGCGVSGLGHLLMDLGYRVSGSDLSLNQEIRQLRSRGAEIHSKHDAAHVSGPRPIAVVYSSAIRSDNPELRAAADLKIPIIRRATLLSALLRQRQGICVAGMHGKTTTTALLAFALEQLGSRPGYAIGAQVPQLDPHARFSSGGDRDWFVAETDESDGTLREFEPEHAILLNVDAEHLDYFANIEAVCREFQGLVEQTRRHLVFCADDVRLAEMLSMRAGAISYGFNPLAQYRISSAGSTSAGRSVSRFEVWHQGTRLGEFAIQLLGEHNVSNATAVIALLHQLGFDVERIARAIEPFRGAARRQQELFVDTRYRVFDDYGHHPMEIAATLRAIRALGARRVLVAFQPHRYTRTQHLLQEFSRCFTGADRLWLTEVYAASEPEIAGVNGAVLADAVRAGGQEVEFVASIDQLCPAIQKALQPGDLVLFLGAGDITRAAHQLADELNQQKPTQTESYYAALAGALAPETVLRRNEMLAKRTTLRVGGPADVYVEPASESELATVLRLCATYEIPFVMLGRGSNLLIRDGGIRGVVICLIHPGFSRIEVVGDRLHCGAGAPLKTIAHEARRNGVTRLEFLEGIPGSLGGALRMNAGAMGSWTFDVVESIRFMDFSGAVHERRASEVNVEYRGCPLFRTHIALGAVLKGESAPRELIDQRMSSSSEKRRTSQPRKPSAGCIFKNPESIPAGKLIDELGLKGTRVGGAVISEVHGNFIINEGGASAQDVLSLIEMVKQRARTSRGIQLETEVEILGE